uniref:Secreted protein n=1 Tax=Parastrongyloides trichosuri TaxID=131310 RepID=A0A0N5A4L2_PARTI
MEQRPQRAVGVAVVVLVDVLRLQIDGGDGDAGPVLDVQLAGEMLDRLAGPAEPQAVVFPQRRRQGHGQAAGRPRRRILGRRNAVGDDNQPAHRASVHDRLSSTAQLMMPTRE